MWVKQWHLHHPPVITIFIGRMFTYVYHSQSWVVPMAFAVLTTFFANSLKSQLMSTKIRCLASFRSRNNTHVGLKKKPHLDVQLPLQTQGKDHVLRWQKPMRFPVLSGNQSSMILLSKIWWRLLPRCISMWSKALGFKQKSQSPGLLFYSSGKNKDIVIGCHWSSATYHHWLLQPIYPLVN